MPKTEKNELRFFQVQLDDLLVRRIKSVCALEDISMRKFAEQAFAAALDQRKQEKS